jgi:hypothetical protein
MLQRLRESWASVIETHREATDSAPLQFLLRYGYGSWSRVSAQAPMCPLALLLLLLLLLPPFLVMCSQVNTSEPLDTFTRPDRSSASSCMPAVEVTRFGESGAICSDELR